MVENCTFTLLLSYSERADIIALQGFFINNELVIKNLEGEFFLKNYHAEILDVSLTNKKMIKDYTILNIRKRFLGLLKIYTISVPENEIEQTIESFQKNLSRALHKEWYITFHTDEQAIVLFREKIFRLNTEGINPVHYQQLRTEKAKDKKNWDEMLKYAKELGVPDDQCDFLPEDYANQQYD